RRQAEARPAAGQQSTREADGVDDRRGQPCADEPLGLAVQKGQVEPSVVRDEDGVACETEKTAHGFLCARGAAKLRVAQAGERGDRRSDRYARIDERLELLGELERADANGADLADARRARTQSRRLEVDDDVRRRLDAQVRAEWRRQP